MKSKDQFRDVYTGGNVLHTKLDIHARYSSIPIDIPAQIAARCGAPNDLAVLDIGCGIPVDEYAIYFTANIPTWDRAPAPDEEADILRRVDQWARADQHEGQIIEPKRVALATCLADG